MLKLLAFYFLLDLMFCRNDIIRLRKKLLSVIDRAKSLIKEDVPGHGKPPTGVFQSLSVCRNNLFPGKNLVCQSEESGPKGQGRAGLFRQLHCPPARELENEE